MVWEDGGGDSPSYPIPVADSCCKFASYPRILKSYVRQLQGEIGEPAEGRQAACDAYADHTSINLWVPLPDSGENLPKMQNEKIRSRFLSILRNPHKLLANVNG